MTKTRASVQKKSVSQKKTGMETDTSVSEISINSSSVALEYVTDSNQVLGVRVEPSANDSSQSLNTFTSSDNVAISSANSNKCGMERHLSHVHGDVTDTKSFAVNCEMIQNIVGSLSDGMAGMPQASVMYNETNDKLSSEAQAVPLVTVANHVTGSGCVAALMMQMPNMTQQLIPTDNARHHGSLVQVRVFSTKLANCAAESVHIGHYDSIIDFHQDYCAVPASQNSRNANCYIPANQSLITCYSEYHASHSREATAAAEEPPVGYTQTGVEQWVRQQNASRQKQEQMAASSMYVGQAYRSCDQIPESGQNCYWSGHHKPVSSGDLSRANMSSSVDLMRRPGYVNMHGAINPHHFYHENCKIPDDNLTVEQRQQRQSKMGRLQVIQQMLTAEQQVADDCVDHMASASYQQSQGPSSIGWSSVPCGDDMYAGPYNTGSQMMNTNSVMRHHSHAPSWDMMTVEQSKWYNMQRESHLNRMGMQHNFYHCHPTDFCNSNVRYFEHRTPVNLPTESCQLTVRERVMPANAVCDFTPVYPLCDSQACNCEDGMSSHMGKHHTLPSSVYGYMDVQPNYGSQQQMNRCNKVVNDKYCVSVGGSRQVTYDVAYKGRADGMQSWNSGEDAMRRQLMAAPVPQQFDVHGQQVMLPRQLNNSYCMDQNVASEPVSNVISCAHAPVPTVAVRQRQPNSRKRKSNDSIAAQPADSKSKKLGSVTTGEWASEVSATKSGTLMNITSASLAHLAKGVENISAVMQQTIQQGGPFRYIQGRGDHADGSDENANFIHAGNLQQIQTRDVLNPVEEKTAAAAACASSTLPIASFQTSCGNSRGSSLAVSAPSHVYSNASTTGVDVVIMSKAPYTISYHPTGILSAGDSGDNVDVKNASTATVSHNAHMVQKTLVEHHMSDIDTALSSRRHTPSSQGFSEHSHQEHSGITCHKNPSDAAKVDRQAAAAGSCLSMASSVALIQPQMMSGTQLFIADRCSVSAPVLNNFVLPTGILSNAFRSPQHSHSMQHDANYQSFNVQQMSVSRGEPNIPVFSSPKKL